MSDLEEAAPATEAPIVRKGRPTGRPDSTQRKRRTAQEISDDKIRVAQLKLDALKEIEATKLANKKEASTAGTSTQTETETERLCHAPIGRSESDPH